MILRFENNSRRFILQIYLRSQSVMFDTLAKTFVKNRLIFLLTSPVVSIKFILPNILNTYLLQQRNVVFVLVSFSDPSMTSNP